MSKNYHIQRNQYVWQMSDNNIYLYHTTCKGALGADQKFGCAGRIMEERTFKFCSTCEKQTPKMIIDKVKFLYETQSINFSTTL